MASPLILIGAAFYASRKSTIVLAIIIVLSLLSSIGQVAILFIIMDIIAFVCAATDSSRQHIRHIKVTG